MGLLEMLHESSVPPAQPPPVQSRAVSLWSSGTLLHGMGFLFGLLAVLVGWSHGSNLLRQSFDASRRSAARRAIQEGGRKRRDRGKSSKGAYHPPAEVDCDDDDDDDDDLDYLDDEVIGAEDGEARAA